MDRSHSDWREMVPHCSFDLHFPASEWCWASFHVFLAIFMSSWEKHLFCPLAHFLIQFSSVQVLSLAWLLATPWIAACQAFLSIPTPRVHSNSPPSSRRCHTAISSSVVPFSSVPQYLPASESFPMNQPFTWGSQRTGVSALASFLPENTQDWSPLKWTDWIGSFIFLDLSCRSCLYNFEASSLSVASLAITFSHSEWCHFPLLCRSFSF